MEKISKPELEELDFATSLRDNIHNFYQNHSKKTSSLSKNLLDLIPNLNGWIDNVSSQYHLANVKADVNSDVYNRAKVVLNAHGWTVRRYLRYRLTQVAKHGLSKKDIKVLKVYKNNQEKKV